MNKRITKLPQSIAIKTVGILLPVLVFMMTARAQTWTNPVNISNMPGLDNQPDLCIDKNGTLHCVFTHKLSSNWRKIYYSKSTNDGETWSIPEDISLNPNTSLMNPHIVADTNNILYVTYDYNTGNPAALLIKLKTFDGNQWSEPITVSEGMYGSEYNTLLIDNNNRLYVFWIYQTEKTYYRYFENSNWSEIFYPYPGNFRWLLSSGVIDDYNNILCAGSFSDTSPPVIIQNTIFFKYDYFSNQWSEKTFISPSTDYGSSVGLDIDIFSTNLPAVTYRQKTYGTGPNNDSTMYTFFDGTNWTEPELVVNDPFEQQIAIDPYDRVHIIDREKLEPGYKLVHYQKMNDLWQGYIIDNSNIVVANPKLIEKDNLLYLIYYKCFSSNDCRIRFTKNELLTSLHNNRTLLKDLIIFPNPFTTETIIEFTLEKMLQANVSVYDLSGKHIKTIENKEFSPGKYQFMWNGTDKNGKEVTSGLYLIRLQAGRHVITKPVEYLK